MYYAELLILIYRYMDESYLPICTNESLKKAISYIRMNYQTDISITDVAGQTGIGERYLRKLFRPASQSLSAGLSEPDTDQ